MVTWIALFFQPALIALFSTCTKLSRSQQGVFSPTLKSPLTALGQQMRHWTPMSSVPSCLSPPDSVWAQSLEFRQQWLLQFLCAGGWFFLWTPFGLLPSPIEDKSTHTHTHTHTHTRASPSWCFSPGPLTLFKSAAFPSSRKYLHL